MARNQSPVILVALMCLAQVLAMTSSFAFPALLPAFLSEWELSNTRAGWISGIYFAAYAFAAPFLSGMTDRFDARLVFVIGAGLTALGAAGFMFATGFWSAMVFRALAGAGLAGTFMPGVRVIVDRYAGARQPRAIAFYTASFSLGTATSFFVAGQISLALSWPAAFGLGAAGAACAAVLALGLRPAPPPRLSSRRDLLDLRPVLRNRTAMGYALGYGIHSWELFTLRSWLVAFLTFSLSQQPTAWRLEPTTVATLSGLVAVVASILGAELARPLGLRRLISAVMSLSSAMALLIGFLAELPYPFLVGLVMVYTVLVQLDSAALTIGVATSAAPNRRGSTLAIHALVGFGCAAIGPLVFGAALDIANPETTAAWGFAFATVGLVALGGPVLIRRLVPSDRNRTTLDRK